MSVMDRALDFWFSPEPPSRLALFERAFALTFLLYMGAWAWEGGFEWLTTEGFHYPTAIGVPGYAPPWPPLLPWQFPIFLAVVFAASGLVALGAYRRPALLFCLGCALYVQRADPASAFTINKLYVVGFAVLVCQPRPTSVMVGGKRREKRQSAWPLRVLQATLVIQYCTAGVLKTVHGDWLQRFDILIGHSAGIYRTELAALALAWLPQWAWVVQGVLALGFELGAPLLFMIRRLRPLGYLLGVGMHVVIALLMVDLIWFALQMVAFYLLFMDPVRTDRILEIVDRPRAWWTVRRDGSLAERASA